MAIPAIIFDDGKGLLSPLTDLRAAFDLRTGAMTTLTRASLWFEVVGLIVPNRLAGAVREHHPRLMVNEAIRFEGPAVHVVSGQAPLAARSAVNLRPGEVWRDGETGDLIAACSPMSRLAALLAGDIDGFTQNLMPLPPERRDGFLFSRPWHIRTLRDDCIKADLEHHVPRLAQQWGWPELPPGTLRWGTEDLAVAKTATVWPGVFFDNTAGPIWIDDHATIRPGAIICGPAYIGPHSTILDRCIIKPNTAIGPHCKIAGEVGGTIFQGFANKAHDGHLGDSYIGEWANLGAGTTNSNLLNTYGEVISQPFTADGKVGSYERTGEQFLGAIIGDHCKFAICTRIMTGAIVGTGTMWAAGAPVTGTVPAFSWVTDAGKKKYALNKFTEVMKTVMGRRKLSPGEGYLRRLEALHAGAAP